MCIKVRVLRMVPRGGVCTSKMSLFHTNFSYIACSMSMNWEFNEESRRDSHMTHGWSPGEVNGVSSSVRSNFQILLVVCL